MSDRSAAAAPAKPGQTRRYLAKRETILDAASALINAKGVRGLSLAEVGDGLGLSSTSITYYFKRRDDLAAACFERALDLLASQVEAAGREATPQARVDRLMALTFEALRSRDARGTVRLSDLRATEDPMRGVLIARFVDTFRRARGFFGTDGGEDARLARTMRTHVLLDTLFTLPSWIGRYDEAEHPRVEARLRAILSRGLALRAARWDPWPLGASPPMRDAGQERFLDVATRLINTLGYRGASVDRISAELNVTKGSFYHHLDAKDNLVLECFRRSLAAVADAQDAAAAVPGDRLRQLTSALAVLLDVQLSDRMPLLRTTALLALPEELRAQVVDRADRIALRFAGMVTDGVNEGSLAPVDPVIAGQVLLSSVNAAFELRERATRVPLARAVELYGDVLLRGVLPEA